MTTPFTTAALSPSGLGSAAMAGRENGIDIKIAVICKSFLLLANFIEMVPFKVGVKKKTQQSRSWDKEIVAPIGADCVRLQVY